MRGLWRKEKQELNSAPRFSAIHLESFSVATITVMVIDDFLTFSNCLCFKVVGRQVLASPVLGEIQVGIAAGRTGIDVEIIRAKNLVVKPGVKVNPGNFYIPRSLFHLIKVLQHLKQLCSSWRF